MSTSARRRLKDHDLVYQCAPTEWRLGAPLGNGHIGVMLWGDGSPLKLTFDRDDLWDLRRSDAAPDPEFAWRNLRELARQGNTKELNEIVERNLNPESRPLTPTKLPLGRLEVTLPEVRATFSGRLCLGDATFRGTVGETGVEVLVAAESPLVVVRLSRVRTIPMVRWCALSDLNPDAAARLGFVPPETGQQDHEYWAEQTFPDGTVAVVAWSMVRRGEVVSLLATVTTTQDGGEPVTLARKRLSDGMRMLARTLNTHVDWWQAFWDRSQVNLPDGTLETLWHYGLYKLGSSSRPGGLPANLQGLWVTDGVLPPWRGDYHCNMNVQETYWPIYGTNHLDLGLPLYDWLDRIADNAEIRTREFFGFDGLRLETAVAADGTPVPGWGTVQYWPGAATWMAHHLWLHWLYSGDETFLRERAYPFMKRCMAFWEGYLEEGDDGRLHVPLSHSPEWNGNLPDAWGRDPAIDLSLVRNLAAWLVEASEHLGIDADSRARWAAIRERLAPYPVDESGSLMVMAGVPLTESHRHPSHLMPIFPLHDVSVEGSDEERRIIERSVHLLERRGTGEWTGWSFPYASLIASRIGRGEMAAYMLCVYADSFIMPNGMHVNGDWRKHGISSFHYDPYTMEAECAATAAVTEMLLQSWGRRIRLFPAVPQHWRDASFSRLLAEGGIEVSAVRQYGLTVSAGLLSKHTQTVHVLGIPEGASWSGAVRAERHDGGWRVGLRAGEMASASAEPPEVAPKTGADLSHRPRPRNILGFRGYDG